MEGIDPHDLIRSAARDCARRWTEEANRAGHHPAAGDAFHGLALALMRQQRLTVPDWDRVRVALACARAGTVIEGQAQLELYQLAKAGQLEQGPDGRIVIRQPAPDAVLLQEAEALGFDLYGWWDAKGPDDPPIPGLQELAAFIRTHTTDTTPTP